MTDKLTQTQIILARSQLWTKDLDKLLRKWKRQIVKREQGHKKISKRYERRHKYFGFPAVTLGSIGSVGMLVVFQDQDCEDGGGFYEWLRLAFSLIAAVGTILTVVLTFANPSDKSEEHKTASDGFGALYRELDQLLLLPGAIRGDPVGTLQNFRSRYDERVRLSPHLPRAFDVELTYNVLDLKTEKSSHPKVSYQGLETPDQIEMKIEEENAHDTSDDEQEVVIGFDLDGASSYATTAAAMAIAQLSARGHEEIQESLQKMFGFEMQRLRDHAQYQTISKGTPPILLQGDDETSGSEGESEKV